MLTSRPRPDKTASGASGEETVSSADNDEIEALHAEVRRLRSAVRALTEEKKDLGERLAFLAQELERMRAKVSTGARTS
jgi:uncharacterized protein YicC (UPF0701 family)